MARNGKEMEMYASAVGVSTRPERLARVTRGFELITMLTALLILDNCHDRNLLKLLNNNGEHSLLLGPCGDAKSPLLVPHEAACCYS